MSEPKTVDPCEGYREEVAAYRSLAVSAIVTLVLGILSFVALFQPTLWVFPLITIGVGFASLYVLAKNPLKMGRKAAVMGLALAFFFLAWGGAHYFSRQQWLIRCARQHADAWLELVRTDRLQDAHQLRVRNVARVEQGTALDDYYAATPDAQADFDRFYGKAPLKTLLQLGPSAQVVYERAGFDEIRLNRDRLFLDYRIDYQESGRPKELPLRIIMARERDPATGQFNWHVASVHAPAVGR